MDDFGGGYSLWGDTPDMGSAWDMGGDFGLSGAGSMPSFDVPSFNFGAPTGGLDSSWLQPYQQQSAPTFTQGAQPMGGMQPGGQSGGGGMGQANPYIGAALGAAGPLAGLIGSLVNQGQGPTSGPQPTTAQKANMGIGNQWAQMGAQGQLPAQQMQMSLLQSLASGQGLPQGYQQLVEQAFQPQMGDLYTQAANMGRSRGFHDAPAQSPPGGAILGPGLSNLQGQMASAKLGLMHSLPQLFNAPAQTQGSFAQNYLGQAQGAPMQQSVQQPMAPQIAQGVGGLISGAAQGYNAAAQQGQQQNTLNQILQGLQGGGITMSGSQPRPMANGGIVTRPTNALIGEAGPEAVVPLNPSMLRAMTGAATTGQEMQRVQQGQRPMGGGSIPQFRPQMPMPQPRPPMNPSLLAPLLKLILGASAAGPERQAMLGTR